MEQAPVGTVGFSSLKIEDIKAILEIERVCFSDPWSDQAFLDVILNPSFQTLAARLESQKLIGYVVFSEVADELHVLNVAVAPPYRRYSIATAMLSYIHTHAVKRGRVFSYLEVRESNTNARRLYKKFGYQPLTRRKEYYSNNQEDAILMTANLTKNPKFS